MQFSGKVEGYTIDLTGKDHITFVINENKRKEYQKIKDMELLAVEVKKYRPKRSLDANAYAWVLMDKIAKVLRTDKWDIYLEMLGRYGKFTHIIVKPEAVARVKEEWRAVKELGEVSINGKKGVQLQVYFGSSTYTTKEMAEFIGGIVEEAQDLGIETMTPAELDLLKREWGT